ncbi:unnamed protein product [Pieris macdunnoughi]|uniref:DDE Tnp4 domain-containing protein n=1 Tax=Pieris macdunnoughi TaxID=345717 RepID=A0A821X4T8_9NEOP|nr:unnamed protein product [Pieris macdunnoughi]
MENLDDFVEFYEYSRKHRASGPRCYLRDFSNPFEKYSVAEFHSRFGFTQNSVKNILMPLLEPDLKATSRRGLPFPPEIMVLLTLRYFATGSFQKLDSNDMNICQQSMSRIVTRVANALAKKMKKFVKFPSRFEDVNKVKRMFYNIANFPGVIGCIDCTHIKIKNPGGLSSEVFRNSTGYFSINVQAVIGPSLEFYNMVSRWPGSTHDSFIYNHSALKQQLDSGNIQGVLLGDNDYSVSNVLLTPFLSPNSHAQEKYNQSHNMTRNVVERAFDVWKKKFPCLQEGMAIKIETVVAVVCACATLHNISLQLCETLNSDEELVDLDLSQENNNSGSLFRQTLVDKYFE